MTAAGRSSGSATYLRRKFAFDGSGGEMSNFNIRGRSSKKKGEPLA